MNVKELRLGNYVNRLGVQKQIKAVQIDSAGLGYVSLGDSLTCNQIDPIPLTEEWLIKFGFKRVQEDKYGCHYENEECWIYLTHGGFDVEVITDDERFNLLRTYKYVHQLQNLYFAITGKELEAI